MSEAQRTLEGGSQIDPTSGEAWTTAPDASRDEPAPPRRRRRSRGRAEWWTTAGILLGTLAFWAAGSAVELWSSSILPSPTAVAQAGADTLVTNDFWVALGITVMEVVASFVAAVLIGFLVGVLFWKVPFLGRICEPYLVSLYAVPFIVFYPIMVAIIALNSWPIIVLATVMGVIPMALNTWIGLAGVPAVYWKLGASLQCSRRQTLIRLAIPAAAPIALIGVRLAAVYALISAVAMEFLLAPAGLGYVVREQYELFEQAAMTFYILIVFGIAGLLAFLVAMLEWRIVGKRMA